MKNFLSLVTLLALVFSHSVFARNLLEQASPGEQGGGGGHQACVKLGTTSFVMSGSFEGSEPYTREQFRECMSPDNLAAAMDFFNRYNEGGVRVCKPNVSQNSNLAVITNIENCRAPNPAAIRLSIDCYQCP